MNEQQHIPEQQQGAQKDFEHMVVYTSLSTAKSMFDTARYRLLEINNWHEYAGVLSADFILTDDNGNKLERLAKVGDYIRIDVPGPSHPNGEYDWVKIETINYEMPDKGNELMSMKLQPSAPPESTAGNKPTHFFEYDSSSSFILKRENNDITISYHGRNETTNIHTDNTLENARNWLIGLSAMLGFSDIQWQGLIKGIISAENID